MFMFCYVKGDVVIVVFFSVVLYGFKKEIVYGDIYVIDINYFFLRFII